MFGVTLIFIVEHIEWAWSKVLFSVDKWIMDEDEIKKEMENQKLNMTST